MLLVSSQILELATAGAMILFARPDQSKVRKLSLFAQHVLNGISVIVNFDCVSLVYMIRLCTPL